MNESTFHVRLANLENRVKYLEGLVDGLEADRAAANYVSRKNRFGGISFEVVDTFLASVPGEYSVRLPRYFVFPPVVTDAQRKQLEWNNQDTGFQFALFGGARNPVFTRYHHYSGDIDGHSTPRVKERIDDTAVLVNAKSGELGPQEITRMALEYVKREYDNLLKADGKWAPSGHER